MRTILQFVILLVFLGPALTAQAGYSVENPPKPCECQFAGKDYDSAKGYYFDRAKYFPYPQITGRFACNYYCQDSQGKYWTVTHIYEGSYVGLQKGGPENAKKMICPQSIAKFIPKYDLVGQVKYYETVPVGNFSANFSAVPEVGEWARRRCQ